jgi:hypothetical protein
MEIEKRIEWLIKEATRLAKLSPGQVDWTLDEIYCEIGYLTVQMTCSKTNENDLG